ncbi:MAG: hypothetical protein JXQ96_10140 [Cyclobacteriaceae bacterium]
MNFEVSGQSYTPDDFIASYDIETKYDLQDFRINPINESVFAIFQFYKRQVEYIEYNLQDSSVVYSNSISIKNSNKCNRVLGHFFEENKSEFYFLDNQKRYLSFFTFDRSTNNFKGKTIVDFVKSNEIFLESYYSDQSLIAVSIKKKSSDIVLRQILANGIIKTTYFDLKGYFGENIFDQLYFKLIQLGESFRDQISIARIDKSSLFDFSITQSRNKIYFRKNQIILTVDNNLGKTLLIRLAKISNKADVKEFDHNIPENCTSNGLLSMNSLVLDNLLYQVSTCRKELIITIIDYSTGKVNAQFSLNKNESSEDFKHAIFKEEIGATLFSGKRDVFTSASKILRKGANYDIAIGLRKLEDGIVRLDVGTYQVKESAVPVILPLPYSIWVYGYIYKEYPYNIFIRNYLNTNTYRFQRNGSKELEENESNTYFQKCQVV